MTFDIQNQEQYKDASIKILHEVNFLKEHEAQFCPLETEEIAGYIGVQLNPKNSKAIMRSFDMACRNFEQLYQRSVIPKIIMLEHERTSVILPMPRVRKILSIQVKSGKKWPKIYVSDPSILEKDQKYTNPFLYTEESFDLESVIADLPQSNDWSQKYAEYGELKVSLNKARFSDKTIIRIISAHGYCYKDIQKMPGATLSWLIRETRDIYYGKEINLKTTITEGELYPMASVKL